ncbi:MAG: alpha/beta hydrolase-fold protein [Planctomycetota bacterium]
MRRSLRALGSLIVLAGCAGSQTEEPFDRWLETIASSSEPGERIVRRIAALGGTPLRHGDELLFLAVSKSGKPPRVVGDFNDGGYQASDLVGDGGMTPIGTSGWFFLCATVPPNTRLEYLIRHGEATATDPLNLERTTTFGTERSVAAGSDVPQAPAPTSTDPRGTLTSFPLTSAIRENEREVTVYLPPGYDASGEPLPTLYVKDGTRFRDEVGLPPILDALLAAERIPPVLVVFVDPVQRGLEYGTYGAYRRMVVEELVPEIERRFASGGAPERRGLLGASRGGLAAVDLLIQHPETFGHCVAMSPAIAPLPILDEIAEVDRIEGRATVLVSRFDTPNLVRDGHALAEALRTRGVAVEEREVPIDHSPMGWRCWVEVAVTSWAGASPPR